MIKQQTSEWLEAKKQFIGASEIYSLIHHYCQSELVSLGINVIEEKPFLGTQELYLKLAGAELEPIDPVLADFGNQMEGYILHRYQLEQGDKLAITETDDFLTNPEFHKLAACSPDGFLEVIGSGKISDFDNKTQITAAWGEGVLELKTSNFFANFNGGAKAQYLFQLQYQMAVAGKKWGALAVLNPTNPEFDSEYFKGQAVVLAKTNDKSLADKYNLHFFVYPILPRFQELITKALNRFQEDFETKNYNNTRAKWSKEIVEREKRILAKIFPEKYGSLELCQEDPLDQCLNELQALKPEKLKLETEESNLKAQIQQLLGSHIEAIGTQFIIKFDKRGAMRIQPNRQN